MNKLQAFSPDEYQSLFRRELNFKETKHTEFSRRWENPTGGLIRNYGHDGCIQSGIGSYIIPRDFSIDYTYSASFLHFGIIYEGITYTIKDRSITTQSTPSVFLCREEISHGIGIWRAGQSFRGVEFSVSYQYLADKVFPVLGLESTCLDFLETNTVYHRLPSDLKDLLFRLEGYMAADTFSEALQYSALLSFLSLLLLPGNQSFFDCSLELHSKKLSVGKRRILLSEDDFRKIQKVHTMIQSQADEFLTISQLASLVGISEQKLKYGFYYYYQNTIWNVQNGIRMTKAAELLNHSEKTVDEIAKAVGYRSQTAFHNSFKNWCGYTPGQFRKMETVS